MSSEIPEYGLIFSDDDTSPEKALNIAKRISPYMDAIKLNLTNTAIDFQLVSRVKETTDKPVIVDLKVADIGFWNGKTTSWEGTDAQIIKTFVNAGADYVTCHTFPGTSSIQECVEVAHSIGGRILTLPYMSGRGGELFFGQPIHLGYTNRILRELDIPFDTGRLYTISDLILTLGEYFEVDGYIGPANNLQVLTRYRALTQRPIYGPGIGRQATGDLPLREQLEQFYRICGRRSAAIIGSAIYNVPDPVKAAEEFRIWRDDIVRF